MIKIIEKIQSKHSTRTTDTPQDTVDENNVSTVDVYQVEAIINPNDPYQGINLEQVSYWSGGQNKGLVITLHKIINNSSLENRLCKMALFQTTLCQLR